MNRDTFAALTASLFPDLTLSDVVRLTGGVSANVYRLDLADTNGSLTRVVLREHGESHSGHPAALEYALLNALSDTSLPVPRPLHLDTSWHHLPNPYLIIAFANAPKKYPSSTISYTPSSRTCVRPLWIGKIAASTSFALA